MFPSTLLEGIIIGILVSIPMGPIGVLCVQRTIHQGRRAGLISGLGAAVADSSFAFIAGFGLTFLTDFFDAQQRYLLLLGAIILIFLGVKLFVTNTIKEIKKIRHQRSNPYANFISVFLLTLSNPITILFFGLMFASLGVVKEDFKQTSVLIGGIFSGALLWWFILTSIVSYFRKFFRIRIIFWINKLAGVLIIIFGLFAAYNAFVPISTSKVENSKIMKYSKPKHTE